MAPAFLLMGYGKFILKNKTYDLDICSSVDSEFFL